jgi:hypothetical protein
MSFTIKADPVSVGHRVSTVCRLFHHMSLHSNADFVSFGVVISSYELCDSAAVGHRAPAACGSSPLNEPLCQC